MPPQIHLCGLMKLYSYIVAHDGGFAPNPFWGYCTLANCKPTIRRTAKVGDWIVGLSPKAKGNRVIYAMQVGEMLTYKQYYQDKRFAEKIPDYSKRKVIYKRGDNIYEPLPNGTFRQLRSVHSKKCQEDLKAKAVDLGGVNILIARVFRYFGGSGPDLPKHLHELKVRRGHKCRFQPEMLAGFLEFIKDYPLGLNAPPSDWPSDDDSWREGSG